MTKVKGFIDADGHVVENDRALLDFLPPPYKGREDLLSFPFFPTLDGFHRQALRVVDGKGRYVAQGSLKELETHLLLAARVGLLKEASIEQPLGQCEALGKMLRSLIRSLQQKSGSR